MSEDRAGEPNATATPSRRALFLAFLKVGALGFGGVAAFARHTLVVERGLLTEREFAESFGLASTLPGANTVNLATMLGDRYHGVTGSIVAVAGLVGMPLVILSCVAEIYGQVSQLEDVRAALAGAAAGAAGLVIGTSLRLLKGLDPDTTAILTTISVFLAAAYLRIPMAVIVIFAVPAALIWSRVKPGFRA